MIGDTMVSASEIIRMFGLLSDHCIRAWLLGGWGVDALLETQTREHKDIDVLIQEEDILQMIQLLELDRYDDFHLWEENRWDIDKENHQYPTAFYMLDNKEREFDVHAIRLDEEGNAIPQWALDDNNFLYTKADISATGKINGVPFPCITAEKQMLVHTGYELPETHQSDMKLIHEKFGVPYPK